MTQCPDCLRRTCLWEVYGGDIVLHMQNFEEELDTVGRNKNNVIRKAGYQYAIRLIFGSLGSGVRRKLPQCVENGVRSMYPSTDGRFMGYKTT